MKIYSAFSALTIFALISAPAFAGGSTGGSLIFQKSGATGIYNTGASGAQGSVDVFTSPFSRNSSVNQSSTAGTVSGVGGAISFGSAGAAVGGVSTASNSISTHNTAGNLHSDTSATNASGIGIGAGGSVIGASGTNTYWGH